jgi:hypothetical protein
MDQTTFLKGKLYESSFNWEIKELEGKSIIFFKYCKLKNLVFCVILDMITADFTEFQSKLVKIDGLDSSWQLTFQREGWGSMLKFKATVTFSNLRSDAADSKTLYKIKVECVGAKNEVIWNTHKYELADEPNKKSSFECTYSKVLDNLTNGNLKLRATVWIKTVELDMGLEPPQNFIKMEPE